MAMPVGVVKKTKNNDNKNYRSRAEWMEGKKLGRPQQQFNSETKTWSKIMEPRKVTE